MRENRLTAEPFELLDILFCQGEIGADRHGHMEISGHIRADKEAEYQQLLMTELWVNIKEYDEDGAAEALFTGIVTAGEIEVEDGVKTLHLNIQTGSFLMDLDEHTRTFQNKNDTYKALLGIVTSGYVNPGFIMNKGKGESIERFLCQYYETDWQFARRLASYCNTWLYPSEIGEGVKFYFGLPCGKDRGNITSTEYSLLRQKGEDTFRIRIRDLYCIGDRVCFLGQNLFVLSRETSWEHGELYHTYELGVQEKRREALLYNDDLTGVSLTATVIGVRGTEVALSIAEDENKAAGGSRWFPYATVYSSPDGTGWYCMPEQGDSVRLYFPSHEEEQAYVFNSVHLASKDASRRSNPDYKSIMNKQGKEILFKPDSILVTNNAGMSLELSDSKGISIISDKKISLISQDSVEITSEEGEVDITAADMIALHQGDTKLELSDKMSFQGARVRLN